MLASETKLDDFFPKAQFLLDGFSKPYRLACYPLPGNVECPFTEINIRNRKWLLRCLYNPHRNNISNHISHFSNYISHYDILFLGGFNSQPSERKTVRMILEKEIIFKILSKKQHVNPPCFHLFLIDRPKCFQSTITREIGISDFHKW